jgi:hypothetical protein
VENIGHSQNTFDTQLSNAGRATFADRAEAWNDGPFSIGAARAVIEARARLITVQFDALLMH